MGGKIFRVNHADPGCDQKICLADYEQSLARHQSNLFTTQGKAAGFSKLDEFRRNVWGEGNFADRVRVRVALPHQAELNLRLSDIATNGEVLYSDIQTMMEMGAVEFWVPDHLCRPDQGVTSYFIFPVQNRREFRELIRELDHANPLQREAMGNVFGLVCLDEPRGGGTVTDDAAANVATPISSALSEWSASLGQSNDSGCPDDDVDYFDEDTGKAVCAEPDPDAQESGMAKAFRASASAIGASLAQNAVSAVAHGGTLGESLFLALQNGLQD